MGSCSKCLTSESGAPFAWLIMTTCCDSCCRSALAIAQQTCEVVPDSCCGARRCSNRSQAYLATGSMDTPKEADSIPARLYHTSVLPACDNGPCATADTHTKVLYQHLGNHFTTIGSSWIKPLIIFLADRLFFKTCQTCNHSFRLRKSLCFTAVDVLAPDAMALAVIAPPTAEAALLLTTSAATCMKSDNPRTCKIYHFAATC